MYNKVNICIQQGLMLYMYWGMTLWHPKMSIYYEILTRYYYLYCTKTAQTQTLVSEDDLYNLFNL